jgi:outer membrane phospholipase A
LISTPKRRRLTLTERGESRRLGAKQHKNSGRGSHKGDATWENFTVDFKEYPKGFTVNQDNWAKAVTDAMKNKNDPAIVVVLGEENKKIRLAIIELSLLEQLIERSTE